MNELISIQKSNFSGAEVEAVNARELHGFLQVGRDFASWMKSRIEQYQFIENQDFKVFTKTGENLLGGRPLNEYYISIDMAKELAMVERNEKGRQARQYFIECERRLKQSTAPSWLSNLSPQAKVAIEDLSSQLEQSNQENQRLQQVCETITNQFSPGMTPPVFCRMLNGVNIQKVQTYLVQKNMIFKTNYGYRAKPAYRDKLFAERRSYDDLNRMTEVVTLTLEGAKRIYKMYLHGELTMKKDWDGNLSHPLIQSSEVKS